MFHITNISLHRYSSLKLAWNLTVISPAVIYIYTIATSCFIVIVVLVLTGLSDIPQMYPTCSRLFKYIYLRYLRTRVRVYL